MKLVRIVDTYRMTYEKKADHHVLAVSVLGLVSDSRVEVRLSCLRHTGNRVRKSESSPLLDEPPRARHGGVIATAGTAIKACRSILPSSLRVEYR